MSYQPKLNQLPHVESTSNSPSGTSPEKPVVVTHLPASATSSGKPKQRTSTNELDPEWVLRELFTYFDVDTEAGTILVKAKRKNTKAAIGTSGVYLGPKSRGRPRYLGLAFQRRFVMAHRLIWLVHYGKWPDNQIDHIDGNIYNNSISNLRDVNQGTNQRNARMRTDNVSGCANVYWKSQSNRWVVVFQIDGKTRQAGSFTDFLEACLCRDKFIEENEELFTYRHGD